MTKEKVLKIWMVILAVCIVALVVISLVSDEMENSDILLLCSMISLFISNIISLKYVKKCRYKDIYFAGGCFWGMEKYLKLVKGVVETEVGYANGDTENPTYEQVYTDTTGYAECVHVRYDSEVTTVRRLTEAFFLAIDPTSVNQQGEDKGTRYRTGVYYYDPEKEGDGSVLKQVFEEQSLKYGKLAVELMPLNNFVKAEEYHQDYLEKNPDGYCHLSPEIFELAKSGRK